MQTTIIVRDENIIVYHPDGTSSNYSGKASTEKDALKDIRTIILETNRTKAIGDMVARAELSGKTRKALGKLKSLKQPK